MRVGWIIFFLLGIPGLISGQTTTHDTKIRILKENIGLPYEISDSLPDCIYTFANQGLWKPDGLNTIPPAAMIKRSGLEILDDKNYTFVLESYAGQNSFEGISTLFASQVHSDGNWRKQVSAVEFTETKESFEIIQFSFNNHFGETLTYIMWKAKDGYGYMLYTYTLELQFSQWDIVQNGRILKVLHDPISSVSSAEIKVLNLFGNTVSVVTVLHGSGQTIIPTGTLPAGIYIIGFSVNDQTETRRVFIPGE